MPARVVAASKPRNCAGEHDSCRLVEHPDGLPVKGLWMLYLRWSWRDLRSRWVQVVAIAFIVAIGSGVYAGLSSSSAWRRTSYDESFRKLGAHDIRVELATGTFVEEEKLRSAVGQVDGVQSVEVRLIFSTQVDASVEDRTILVPGRIIGVDVSNDGPGIDRVLARRGRTLQASDAGADTAVLDYHFAHHHDLPAEGHISVGTGVRLNYVGQGLQPEYLIVQGEYAAVFAEASYAVSFVPLATAQRISGQESMVNDAVVRLRPGARRDEVAQRIRAALGTSLPGAATTVSTLEEEPVRTVMYDDIDGDQRFYDIFSIIILGGATFAAFNLVTRIVESQRREIGIGMALGVEPRFLAIRPLLVGLQVAVLGALFGVLVGLVVGRVIADVNARFFPLPIWKTPFQLGTFAKGVTLGMLMPFVATLWPVWRAVRVDPIRTLRPSGAASLRSGLTPWVKRIARDASSLRLMPIRNVVRTPRRSLLTALAVATSIATSVGVIGMIDSVLATIDQAETEVLASAPERMTIDLTTFQVASGETVSALKSSPLIRDAEPYLRIGGRLGEGSDAFETLVIATKFDSKLWHPSALEGSLTHDRPGLVLSRKASKDLRAPVGSTVLLRHPVRVGLGYRWQETRFPVLAVHGNPLRALVYIDLADASVFNLDGIVNALQAQPASGITADEVKRGLFPMVGVGAVDLVSSSTDGLRKVINESVGVLDVVRLAVLLLALLIAFNSSSIGADERAREHATMFAFGVPIRRVLAMMVIESTIIGTAGTLFGIGLGYGIVSWLVGVILPETLPDLAVVAALKPSTVLTAALLGTVVVAVAPVFTLLRLRRMDIPSTLRVME